MPKAASVHIGLNHVDRAAYDGWDGVLAGCVNDAHDLSAVAASEGFRTSILTDRQATAPAVLAAIRAAATRLRSGDIFLLTFSGHGGQICDTEHGGDPPVGHDETWVCWDRQLLDDEVAAALAGFEGDVRVLVVSDTSHCGTRGRYAMAASPPVRTPDGARRARLMPAGVAGRDALHRHAIYERARRNARAELRRAMARLRTLTRREAALRKSTACLAARVVLLTASQDNQVAYDGPGNGAFTAALLSVWDQGRFDGSHREFASAIRAKLTAQSPTYLAVGHGDPAWEASRPFTVDLSADLELIEDPDAAVTR
ncbi:MAG TPA: caspase family protein [Pseudonocardiaceae bacterium]